MLESTFENGMMRIESKYEKTLTRFRIDGYAYVTIYRGVIVEAGFDGRSSNHCYLRNSPNWDRAIEVLSAFRNKDQRQFDEICQSISKRNSEYKKHLVESANRFLTQKINKLKGQAQTYELILISILG